MSKCAFIIGFILSIALGLCFVSVKAHSFTFTWDDPVQRTDGTPLDPDTELKSYQLECSGPENVTRFVDRSATIPVNTNRRQYVWTNAVITDGIYSCRAAAVDTNDLESLWSETVSVLKVQTPVPPTDFREINEWTTTIIEGSIN